MKVAGVGDLLYTGAHYVDFPRLTIYEVIPLQLRYILLCRAKADFDDFSRFWGYISDNNNAKLKSAEKLRQG